MNIYVKTLVITLFSIILLACKKENNDVEISLPPEPKSLQFTYTAAPIDLGETNTKFVSNISYDQNERNTFDIFLPSSSTSTGLVIFIHGGGFTEGNKEDIYQSAATSIRSLLENNLAFASINYQLLDSVDQEGVLKSLNNSKRCLQFIRHHAHTLNIDKDKIALWGSSAGAGTALWLALNDDFSLPEANDPVLKESTRVSAVAAQETQATYDIYKWESHVFKDYGFKIDRTIQLSNDIKQLLLSFYGAKDTNELKSEAITAYRKKVDLLTLLTADDPEIWLSNTKQEVIPPINGDLLFHHAFHVRELKKQADAVGVTNRSYYGKNASLYKETPEENVVDFLTRKLKE